MTLSVGLICGAGFSGIVFAGALSAAPVLARRPPVVFEVPDRLFVAIAVLALPGWNARFYHC
jgi:hypothetical protein